MNVENNKLTLVHKIDVVGKGDSSYLKTSEMQYSYPRFGQ